MGARITSGSNGWASWSCSVVSASLVIEIFGSGSSKANVTESLSTDGTGEDGSPAFFLKLSSFVVLRIPALIFRSNFSSFGGLGDENLR